MISPDLGLRARGFCFVGFTSRTPKSRISMRTRGSALIKMSRIVSNTSSTQIAAILIFSLRELATGLWNDLEDVAIRRCPVITHSQELLLACGAAAARLSGSGPSVFGLCRDHAQARTVAERLRLRAPASWRIEIIHTDSTGDVSKPLSGE